MLNLASGVMVLFLGLTLLIAGSSWIGWRVLQSRMITCPECGVSTLKNSSESCPMCGSNLSSIKNDKGSQTQDNNATPASSATVDISAEDAGTES